MHLYVHTYVDEQVRHIFSGDTGRWQVHSILNIWEGPIDRHRVAQVDLNTHFVLNTTTQKGQDSAQPKDFCTKCLISASGLPANVSAEPLTSRRAPPSQSLDLPDGAALHGASLDRFIVFSH